MNTKGIIENIANIPIGAIRVGNIAYHTNNLEEATAKISKTPINPEELFAPISRFERVPVIDTVELSEASKEVTKNIALKRASAYRESVQFLPYEQLLLKYQAEISRQENSVKALNDFDKKKVEILRETIQRRKDVRGLSDKGNKFFNVDFQTQLEEITLNKNLPL